MIFCLKSEPAMISFTKLEKTYQRFALATMQAMDSQCEQMMKQIGIEPRAGQETELFKSFGAAKECSNRSKEESMENATQDKPRSPHERVEVHAYMKEHCHLPDQGKCGE